MASYKSVIVLTPNGRRQTVKVTPNTTLLQVLEEASAKHGFNSKDFDLKHHNKIMNVDNVIRFTGLPNNALLEMVAAVKMRQDTEVFLGIQAESGERFTGKFMPSESLWSILCQLCPDEVSKDGNPVAVYMRTEVSGRANLETTTLRSLGITGGRAMIRLMHRSPEELRVQANVSTPLARPSSKHKTERLSDTEAKIIVADKFDNVSSTEQMERDLKETIVKKDIISSKTECEESKDRSPLHNERKSVVDKPTEVCVQEPVDEEMTQLNEDSQNEGGKESFQGKETKTETNLLEEEEPMDVTDSKKNHSTNEDMVKFDPCPQDDSLPVAEEPILLPGNNCGCVFSLDNSQPTSAKFLSKDLPDEFFEVTLEDARVWLRDLKHKRAELEDAPLLTSALRHQHEMHLTCVPCVLRIMFPDRIVLQGCFVGGETVEDVKHFVQENLEKPQYPFHLYIAPPKVILKPESFLYEVDGFPTTLIYFAYDKNTSSEDSTQISGAVKKQYLRHDVLSKLTSQTSATKVAQKSRGIMIDKQNIGLNIGDSVSQCTSNASTEPSTSKSAASSEVCNRGRGAYHNKPSAHLAGDKVPKWFHSAK